MTFRAYLIHAAPPTLSALIILLAVVTLIIRPQRGLERDTLSARLSVQVMNQLYRNVRLDRRRFFPVAGLLTLMLMLMCYQAC